MTFQSVLCFTLHPYPHKSPGGERHLLTTLECTILEELTRDGVENGLAMADAGGEDF